MAWQQHAAKASLGSCGFLTTCFYGCRADGPLLAAVRSGAWVLLDELNLASQMVLEGLNAVLDHRAEASAASRATARVLHDDSRVANRAACSPPALQVFIPELNRTFRCPATFRVFGAQNPLQEGGGRKGLPKSFLNRFTRVHVELLQQADLLFIAGARRRRATSPCSPVGAPVTRPRSSVLSLAVVQGSCTRASLRRPCAAWWQPCSACITMPTSGVQRAWCWRLAVRSVVWSGLDSTLPPHLQPLLCGRGWTLGVQFARPAEVVRAGRVGGASCTAGHRRQLRGRVSGCGCAALRCSAVCAASAHS